MSRSATEKIKKEGLLQELKKSNGLSRPVWQALIFRLAGLGFIFLLQVLLARLMGPAHFGDYTVIITTINLLIVLSVFGFDSSVLRYLPAYMTKGEMKSANGFVKFSYRIITIASVACSIGLFIFLIIKAKKFHISFSEGFFWGIFVIPLLAFIYQASAILRALNKIKTSLVSAYFLLPVMMGIFCSIYYYVHGRLTVDAAMLNYLGVAILVSIYINKRAGSELKEKTQTEETEFRNSHWIAVSSVLFLTTAFDLLLRQSDILMVSYFLGNTKAGYYAVSAKLAVLASLGLSVADYIFMPKISALYESRQFEKLQQMIRNSSLQILSITLPTAFILFIAGKWILGLFGNSFATSYVPLAILLCGQVINAATGMVGGLMMMTGHQKMFFTFYLLAFTFQFFLNIILIKAFGIVGTAIGTSFSMIVLNVCAYIFVKKKLKIKASFF